MEERGEMKWKIGKKRGNVRGLRQGTKEDNKSNGRDKRENKRRQEREQKKGVTGMEEGTRKTEEGGEKKWKIGKNGGNVRGLR